MIIWAGIYLSDNLHSQSSSVFPYRKAKCMKVNKLRNLERAPSSLIPHWLLEISIVAFFCYFMDWFFLIVPFSDLLFFFFIDHRLAGRSLSMMLKRWPSLTANCVLRFTGNLCDPKSPEHVILGSCAILASQNVLRHLTTVTYWTCTSLNIWSKNVCLIA